MESWAMQSRLESLLKVGRSTADLNERVSPTPMRPTASRKDPRRRRSAGILGTLGDLEVRLATTQGDVLKAQQLRFEIFYEEMSADASPTTRLMRRDADRFDSICDHLLVEDNAGLSQASSTREFGRVVGTYRMLRQDVAEKNGGFYSQEEFNLAPLIEARRSDGRFLELGRSCVLPMYRSKRTVELLWQGLWAYIRQHDVSVVIGCASFPGTDPTVHASALSFLHHCAAAPAEWSVQANQDRRVGMNMVPVDELNLRQAMRELPPLIRGYIRVGCYVGDGAVVDTQFGTTDVLMILPVDRIGVRYITHFT